MRSRRLIPPGSTVVKRTSRKPYTPRKTLCSLKGLWGLIFDGRGIPRGNFFLTTKVKSEEHGFDPCAAAVENSFQKLGGPWDLILLHDPSAGKEKRLEAYRALGASVRWTTMSASQLIQLRQSRLKRLAWPTQSVSAIFNDFHGGTDTTLS